MTISRPSPLGATVLDGGTQFAVVSRHATKVTLELFDAPGDVSGRRVDLDPKRDRTGDVWHVFVPGVRAGQLYGWRVDGPWAPFEGLRFNANKLLMDPYARAYSGALDANDDAVFGHDRQAKDADLRRSERDSAHAVPRSVVVGPLPRLKYPRPHTAWERTVIYEVHVGAFTSHPSTTTKNPGTYLGLIDTIPHLRRLGVTAVELLPIMDWNAREPAGTDPVTGATLYNYWGYSTLGFFAPETRFTTTPDAPEAGLRAITEFREMVDAMHAAGIEVILDVVYNHTGEGSELGPTLSFRGLDNPTWYVLERGRHYRNASGCGNTLRCAHPTVRRFILDSLHYWVAEMGVDGFRFDLATILGRDSHSEFITGEGSLLWEIAHDPILADVKLISESWDAEGMVKVGALPDPFSEWNGRFRDDVRRFVRGDPGIARDLARRIGGSRDPFKSRTSAAASLNFVTCHDGFTLRDLVSYGTKHNVRNGEGNRDGTNDNHSDNCGVEGETEDGRIRALRKQQAKNFLVTLFTSRGVPMLLGGDELWRTQQGNNNPWCQDNELSWFDWTETPESAEMTRFVAGLIALRGRLRALHQTQFCDPFDAPRPDLHWHGIRLGEPDFSHASRTLAVHFRGGLAHTPPGPDRWTTADVFLVLNAWRTALDFQLPGGREWRVAVNSAEETPRDLIDLDKAPLVAGRTVRALAYSSLLLVSAAE